MSTTANKYHPSGVELNAAIAEILDKAVNADAKTATANMVTILQNEHPQWKLRERRVGKYMKRQLNAKKDPAADLIDADVDEETVITVASNTSFFGRMRTARKQKALDKANTKWTHERAQDESVLNGSTMAVNDGLGDAETHPLEIPKSIDTASGAQTTSGAYTTDDKDEPPKTGPLCDGMCVVS